MYQQSIGKCPYLGNTPVSLFSYVHGDISAKYILGISQGWSLGTHLRGEGAIVQTAYAHTCKGTVARTARSLPQEL
jgi:hypothetical protein